jgi:hypothetical protein
MKRECLLKIFSLNVKQQLATSDGDMQENLRQRILPGL